MTKDAESSQVKITEQQDLINQLRNQLMLYEYKGDCDMMDESSITNQAMIQ